MERGPIMAKVAAVPLQNLEVLSTRHLSHCSGGGACASAFLLFCRRERILQRVEHRSEGFQLLGLGFEGGENPDNRSFQLNQASVVCGGGGFDHVSQFDYMEVGGRGRERGELLIQLRKLEGKI